MRVNNTIRRLIIHLGQPNRRASGLLVSGLTVAAVAIAVQRGLPLFQSKSCDSTSTEGVDSNAGQSQSDGSSQSWYSKERTDKGENMGHDGNRASFGSDWFARTFYDGGFEEKMNKREAALILGVRESAVASRIKDAHRKILLLNHPDRGGSVYIAAKINEAKDLLLKGKK